MQKTQLAAVLVAAFGLTIQGASRPAEASSNQFGVSDKTQESQSLIIADETTGGSTSKGTEATCKGKEGACKNKTAACKSKKSSKNSSCKGKESSCKGQESSCKSK